MSNAMSLDEVERLVDQLGSPERLRLAARICEQLSTVVTTQGDADTVDHERRSRAHAWLAACDAVAESIDGRFDAVDDLRQIRNERAEHA